MRRARASRLWRALCCAALGCTRRVQPEPVPAAERGGGARPRCRAARVSGRHRSSRSEPVRRLAVRPRAAWSTSRATSTSTGTAPTSSTATSVQAVVTKQGSTQAGRDRAARARRRADIYSGRISLGATSPSGNYTLDGERAAARAAPTGIARVDFQIDGGPIIIITSPRRGRSYKRTADRRGRSRPDAFGLARTARSTADAPCGSIDVPLTPSRRSADTYPRHDRLRSAPESAAVRARSC